jgi:acetyl esterase
MPRRRQALVLRAAGLLPRHAARRLAGRSPVPEGAVLAADQALLLRLVDRMRWPALDRMSYSDAQEEARREAAVLAGRRLRVDVLEMQVPGVGAARLYARRGMAPGGGLIVWLHGGGWVLGDLAGHDAFCRRLAHRSGARVLAVTYRRAPAAPFPAAAQDAVAAVRWAREAAARLGADPERIGVGGDSAGGNLAAGTALALREELAFQVLLYPVTDCSREHPSYSEFEHGPWLTASLMRWFRAAYLPGAAARADPRASPLLAADLSGAPPSYVGIAGVDPLRDEARAYARRLEAAGVDVTIQEFPAQLHGYAELAGVSRSARAATLAAAEWIRARVHHQ